MTYQAGQKLGNYRLVRPLGRGGFAEVYLAQHTYLKKQAAIKVLQQRLSDEALEKFLREARLIASLEHPHIVRVLEFGIEEQRPFLVMGYAPYGTLRRYLRNTGASSPAAISPYINQIAAALQYAHERKIVHRDVKPENILLDTGNSVLLSDFGLAVEARSSYHTNFTDSAGTTAYMSPEQLRGKPSYASDQYALAVVIYEWLCKALPFDGPDMSIVVQHFHESPPPLREHAPSLSPAVEAVVLRALEKDPQKRFGSVVDLARAFEEASKDITGIAATSVLSFAPENGLESGIVAPSSPLTLSEDASFVAVSTPEMPSSGELHLSSDRFSSLNAPPAVNAASFSASLVLSGSPSTITDPEVSAPVVPGPRKSRISRRAALLAGLVGAGALLGGTGLWGLSNGKLSTISSSSRIRPTMQGTTTTRPEATPQTKVTPTSGGDTTSGSAPASTDQNIQPTASSGSSPAGTPSGTSPTTTPTSAPGVGPGSTPGVTPTVTPSIAISARDTVVNGTPLSVSVTTNMGSVAFNLIAVYSGLKNPKKNIPPDRVTGSTNSSGGATAYWTPSLPRNQVASGTQASLQVTATSKNGTVSSQTLTVSITR